MHIVKNYKILLIAILLIIPLIVLTYISLNYYDLFNIKFIEGTIINKDDNSIEIITKNDSIYKIINSDDFDIGNGIIIYYKGKINESNYNQNIEIKKIKNKIMELNYSNETIEKVKQMTLNEKIGQLLLVRVPETNKIETIKKYNIGGYILFQRDIKNKTKNKLIEEINSYQLVSSTPLFIAIDEEGGTVSRLSKNKNIVKTPFLSPQELYKNGGFERIKEDAIKKRDLLKELGINMNLAPVADISTNTKSYIYNRTFGKDKNETSKFIETIMSTQNNDVTYVLKHFPGYSDNIDTHSSIAVDKRSYKTIKNNDFIPFKTGIENGANAIMVSHNITENIDNKPSSLSINIHNILKNELEFNGIIITDDLSMNAIKESNSNTPYLDAVIAGNNLLIVTDYIAAYDEIYYGVINNTITEELIDRLILKNIELKEKLNLYK